MQAARLSHFFDLRGPSFTMDTACSSTLVALHQACQSLRNGECKSAIVGGCHLNLLPEFWISMSQSRYVAVIAQVSCADNLIHSDYSRTLEDPFLSTLEELDMEEEKDVEWLY